MEYDARLRVTGTGPPLIYVPGMDGTGELFYRQVPALARRYRVATYRLRDDATAMDTLATDLERVIRLVAPGGEPAILVGESFGGALSMTFALERPAMVRALVLLNTFPFFQPQVRLRLARAGITLIPWGAILVVRRLTAFRLHSRHTHRDEMREFLRHTRNTTRRGYLGRLRILTRYDVRDRLRELRMPVLLLAADRDNLIPSVAQARLMAERLPDATTVILRGHGHSCFLARSLDMSELIGTWIAGRA